MSKTVIARGGEKKCRVVKMHLKLRSQQLKKSCIHIWIGIYKLHGDHKPKIYNRYIHKKRERNSNITLMIVIKSQGKRTKEGERNKKKNCKNNHKTINKMAIVYTYE